MKMKTFDEILLNVNIEMLPGRQERFKPWLDTPEEEVEENLGVMYQAVVANNKITEADDTVPVIKGTRKPTNRGERRKATIKAKRRLKEKEPLTQAVRITRNGGVLKRGDTYSWLPEWKHMRCTKRRHDGKEICRDYVEEDDTLSILEYWYDVDIEKEHIKEDDFDPDFNPWGYTYKEKCQFENLHGDFSDEDITKIINDYHNYDCDDYEDYFVYDPYQSAIDDREAAWEEIGKLKKEIATYKDFLGEFNLNTLYERWLADNNS